MSYWCQHPDLTFDPENHIYRWKSCERPSVSKVLDSVGVLKPAKENDGIFKKVSDLLSFFCSDIRNISKVSEILKLVGFLNSNERLFKPVGYGYFSKQNADIASFGNTFHKIAPAIVLNQKVSYPESMDPWVTQLRKYLSKYPLFPLKDKNGVWIIEYPMYSVRYGFCGTPDMVCKNLKDEICIVDWKTSSAHEKHYNYQTGAYDKLTEEVHGIKAKHRITVRVTESEVDPLIRTNKPEDWIMFQSCINVLKMAA